MITRELPRAEWHRLAGTELETVWPHLREDEQVFVVEADDQIVGCWALMKVFHAEGVWVHPDYRKTSVALRLWRAMRTAVGVRAVVTSACSDDVRDLLKGRAMKLAGDHYVLTMGGR